jgi:hypothetical protein
VDTNLELVRLRSVEFGDDIYRHRGKLTGRPDGASCDEFLFISVVRAQP